MSKVLDTISVIGAIAMAATPLLAIGGVAHAAESRPAVVHVAVGDLDFGRTEDVALFRRRVDVAANAFCGQTSVVDLEAMSTCRQAIREEAVDKLGSSQRQALLGAQGPWSALRLAAR